MKKLFIILSSLFFLNACNDEEKDVEETVRSSENIEEQPPKSENPPKENDAAQPSNSNSEEEENHNDEASAVEFNRYFKPADSTAYFIGDGNEYASYSEKTKWLSEDYIATIIDNGGAVIMKVYRIEDHQIVLIVDELVETDPDHLVYPELEALRELPALEIFLAGPLKVGTSFDQRWTIVETDFTLVTPYQTFKNVIVLEETGEGFTNKKYFVENYGVVKTVSIMSAELTEEVTVTSTLEEIH